MTVALSAGLGAFTYAPAAHADPVITLGYDSEGNPVYFGAGEFDDPDETSGLDDSSPYSELAEMISGVGQPDLGKPLCDPAKKVTTTNLKNKFKVDWNDAAINDTSSKATITVKAEVATTYTYGLSVSVTAEAKAAIFAKVSGTINGSVQKSKMTTYGSTFAVEVAPRKTVKVDRGMWQERFSYKYWSIDKYCTERRSSGTGQAPYRTAWKAYN